MQVLGKGANGGLIVLVDAASAAALQASVAALRGAAEAAQALSALIPETAAVAPAQAAKRKVSGKPKGRKGQTATASVPGSARPTKRPTQRNGKTFLVAVVRDLLVKERAPMAVKAILGRISEKRRIPGARGADLVAQACSYLTRLGELRRVGRGVYQAVGSPKRQLPAGPLVSDEERIRLIAERQRALDREG